MLSRQRGAIMAYRNVQDLYREILAEGGATVSVDLQDVPDKGYVVALPGVERQIPLDRFEVADLFRYLADHFPLLNSDETVYFGAWLDAGTSTVYLDCSVVLPDLRAACELARLNEQIAFWDLTTAREWRQDDFGFYCTEQAQ